MKKNLKLFLILSLSIALSSEMYCQKQNIVHKDDILKITKTEIVPDVDGSQNDKCWASAKWQPINQVWIPYAGSMDKNDFTGQYKILWSERENLLYFLVKTVDDVFVDGFVDTGNPSKPGQYYDYDLLEVFIDENQSGGVHIFDDNNSNGENAFAYHINLNAPEDGKTTTKFKAYDIAGLSWSNYHIANYANHFKEFVMKKNGTEYCWEFSIAVYNDSYDQANPEKSRVKLSEGKPMGISLAYCDNDGKDEEPKTRDNFIGSVFVEAKANNNHWQNCSDFRKVVLAGALK